mgnify:CR=1 FL=1
MKNRRSYFWWKRLAKQLAREEGKLLCPYQETNSEANFISPLKLPHFHTGRPLVSVSSAVCFLRHKEKSPPESQGFSILHTIKSNIRLTGEPVNCGWQREQYSNMSGRQCSTGFCRSAA